MASNNTVSRCGRHTFHRPATGILFVGKAWWLLIAILLTFVTVMAAVAIHEVGFTRKLKPYFSKTDFAVCERKNDKYRTAPELAFTVNATG